MVYDTSVKPRPPKNKNSSAFHSPGSGVTAINNSAPSLTASASTPYFQPKSILRNSSSKSTNISKSSTNNITRSSTTSSSGSKKRLSSIFRKISIEWNLFVLRLKSISEEVFVTDEYIDDLFTDCDLDDTLDRLSKSYRGFTPAEEKFLQDFKKYKSLENLYRAHQRELRNTPSIPHIPNNPASSMDTSTTVTNTIEQRPLHYSLQDVIRQSADSISRSADLDDDNLSDDDMSDDDNNEEEDDDELSFADVNVVKLRMEYENHLKKLNELNDDSTDSSSKTTTSDHVQHKNINIGEQIWEFRRSKWLKSPPSTSKEQTENKISERLSEQSIQHIPKDSYPKIYSTFVDKGKNLKNDKRLNLTDLIKIINAGWVHEEKWARAAKGLA